MATSRNHRILLCDCEGSLPVSSQALEAALGRPVGPVSDRLCRNQLARLEAAAAGTEPVLVACTQEVPLFLETAAAAGATPRFVNIREKAGWSRAGAAAGPKMAALLAEAQIEVPGPAPVSMTSGGVVLVIGRDQGALQAAQRLAERMDVTLLLTGAPELAPPRVTRVPIYRGDAVSASGHLGAFAVEIEAFRAIRPSARGALRFEEGRATRGRSECDVILDLRGQAPLFPSPDRRDGYFNPDPGDALAVARALFDITDLEGEFEKPRYVAYDAHICAHARSGIVGCARCLDHCPASAIAPDGDHVAIDPYLCAGCGSCAGVCPTGAAAYMLPPGDVTLERLRILLETYAKAGGTQPVLLIHDGDHGEDMLDAMARHYDGLPAEVLPFVVNAVTQCGLEALLAARAFGAERILLLLPPRLAGESAGVAETVALANHILAALGYGEAAVALVAEADPEALCRQLWEPRQAAVTAAPATFVPIGGKRDLLRATLAALHRAAPAPADEVALPAGAPFGTIEVDVENCTLCLACVGACPANALRDDPDYPRLSFVEDACVQCGLCRRTCPESVIRLRPRLDFTGEARNPRLIKEEAPFHCVSCGKPFGVKATIESMVAKLAAHAMFADEPALNRLRMCADCRVIDLSQSEEDPFRLGARPVPRTTDDYLAGRYDADDEADEGDDKG